MTIHDENKNPYYNNPAVVAVFHVTGHAVSREYVPWARDSINSFALLVINLVCLLWHIESWVVHVTPTDFTAHHQPVYYCRAGAEISPVSGKHARKRWTGDEIMPLYGKEEEDHVTLYTNRQSKGNSEPKSVTRPHDKMILHSFSRGP